VRAVARIICPLLTMQPHPQSVVMLVPAMAGKLVLYVIQARELKCDMKDRMWGGAPSIARGRGGRGRELKKASLRTWLSSPHVKLIGVCPNVHLYSPALFHC